MMQSGAHGTLQSTIPPVTPAAWTTIFTGKNPGRHGIYDFQKFDRQTNSFRTLQTHQHQEKTLWMVAGENGKRSVLVDVPFTFPPRPIDGLMITGYGTPRTPDTVFTYPPELRTILPNDLHDEIRVALPSHRFDRSQRFIEEWGEIMDGRQALLSYLVSEESWDLFMVVFSITDNMAHVFWTYTDPAHPNYYRSEAKAYREAFFNAYEQCDRLLTDLMHGAGTYATTLVISDHGFGSVRPRQYLFQRLLEGGYLAALGDDEKGARVSEKLLKFAVTTYSRFPAIRELVKGLTPGRRKVLKSTLQRAGVMPGPAAVDLERSRVILSDFGLQIWVNEAGRFAQSRDTQRQRERFLQSLSDYLLSDVDQVSGQRIVRAVHRGRDVYDGPYVSECPDLIIEYNNLFDITGSKGKTNSMTEGGHTHDGIFLAMGPRIAPGEVDHARLVDIAPTVLHLLELAVPPDVDGRVLEEILTSEYKRRYPIRIDDRPARLPKDSATTPYSEEQEAEIREQLRQLGYL